MAEKTTRASFHLPEDSIIEILSRLPAKSVLRFKSVCKAWYTMIKTPNFIKKHEKDSRTITSILAIAYSQMFFTDDGYFKAFGFESNFSNARCFGLLGIANGLVCLHRSYDYEEFSYIVGNPTTKDFQRVPSPKLRKKTDDNLYSGFSFFINDYKLVRVVYHSSLTGEVIIKAEVCSMSTCSWAEIDAITRRVNNVDHLISYWSCNNIPPVFQNGVFYWRGYSVREARVVSFDISEGIYDEINIPSNILDENDRAYSLFNVGENSWRIVEFDQEISLIIYKDHTFKVWALNENRNSWACKLWVDDIPIAARTFDNIERTIAVVGYKCNGEVLIKYHSGTNLKLFLYDLNSHETKILPCADVPVADEFYFYNESLISIKALSEAT